MTNSSIELTTYWKCMQSNAEWHRNTRICWRYQPICHRTLLHVTLSVKNCPWNVM